MKTVTIDPVTRLEGHAKVTIELDDDNKVSDGRIDILELRGFEKILEGMEIEKMPLVTARICGVCPVSHHLTSAKALDKAFGVDPPRTAKLLRELMHMGQMIHSHALHFIVMAGPDLVLGLDSDPSQRNLVGMIRKAPELVQDGLRLRTLGQKIVETVGGRGVHPVTAVPGGITFQCRDEKRKILADYSKEALGLAVKLVDRAKTLLDSRSEIDELEIPTYYLGTVDRGHMSLYEGTLRWVDREGKTVVEYDASDYKKYIVEGVISSSYMKPVYFVQNGRRENFRVGSLARINVADRMETPLAQKEFQAFRDRFGRPVHRTVLYHLARMIELLYACEKAGSILEDPEISSDRIRVPISGKPVNAVAHIEAPRGVLIHDYEVDDRARVKRVNLIVATQQNYAPLNETIRQAAVRFLEKSDREVLNGIEFAIRCYDPCLSCATHAVGPLGLEVDVVKRRTLIRTIKRD